MDTRQVGFFQSNNRSSLAAAHNGLVVDDHVFYVIFKSVEKTFAINIYIIISNISNFQEKKNINIYSKLQDFYDHRYYRLSFLSVWENIRF